MRPLTSWQSGIKPRRRQIRITATASVANPTSTPSPTAVTWSAVSLILTTSVTLGGAVVVSRSGGLAHTTRSCPCPPRAAPRRSGRPAAA